MLTKLRQFRLGEKTVFLDEEQGQAARSHGAFGVTAIPLDSLTPQQVEYLRRGTFGRFTSDTVDRAVGVYQGLFGQQQ